MVSVAKAFEARIPEVRKGSYFRSCAAVLTDTLANQIYGTGSPSLASAADIARKEHPKASLAVEQSAKYAFWIGAAFLGSQISRHTGPAFGYTAAYAHPFVVGAAVRAVRSDLPKMEARKPGLIAFLASFGAVELLSTPIFIAAFERLSRIAGRLDPLTAGASEAAANVLSFALEYAGFRLIWKKLVLRDMEGGSIRDELRGFLAEFNPLKLFRSRPPYGAPSTSGESAGRMWGIVSSLWLWVQIAGIATAAAVASLHQASADNLIDLFYQKSALWGKKFLEVFALARLCVLAEERLKDGRKEKDPPSQDER